MIDLVNQMVDIANIPGNDSHAGLWKFFPLDRFMGDSLFFQSVYEAEGAKFPVDQGMKRLYTLIMLLTIEVVRDEALNLLSDMERLDLIRVNSFERNGTAPEEKLSQQFAGALHLSDTAYDAYQNALREGRNEWRKDVY